MGIHAVGCRYHSVALPMAIAAISIGCQLMHALVWWYRQQRHASPSSSPTRQGPGPHPHVCTGHSPSAAQRAGPTRRQPIRRIEFVVGPPTLRRREETWNGRVKLERVVRMHPRLPPSRAVSFLYMHLHAPKLALKQT